MFTGISIHAQDKNWGVGIGTYQSKDLLLTPRRYLGVGINFQKNYETNTERFLKLITLSSVIGVQKDRLSYYGLMIGSHYSYNLLYKLKNETLSVGLKFAKSYNNHYFFGIDDGHLYWLASMNLQPSVRYKSEMKNGRNFIVNCSFVLAGVNSRPNYPNYMSNFKLIHLFTNQFKNLSFVSVADYLSPTVDLLYFTPNKRKFGIQFQYQQYQEIQMLSYGLNYIF